MDLYKLALTHSSYSKDHPDEPNNERLEFYGDAVLKLVFSKFLFDRYPNSGEGTLTKYRARLISDSLLAKIGFDLSFDDKLIVGSSLAGKPKPKSIVGDAVEAHIGALYIDQGYEAAEKFILENWQKHIEQAIKEAQTKNYKARLQELIQKDYNEAPVYDTLESSGPDHDKEFLIGVYFRDRLLGQGAGNSKKEASQVAAEDALKNLAEQKCSIDG